MKSIVTKDLPKELNVEKNYYRIISSGLKSGARIYGTCSKLKENKLFTVKANNSTKRHSFVLVQSTICSALYRTKTIKFVTRKKTLKLLT